MSEPVPAGPIAPTKSYWFVVMLCAGLGAVLVSLGMTAARAAIPEANLFYWVGLLLMVAPAAVRLTSATAARGERVALLVGVGLWLYLVKILHSPTSMTLYDELLHWRTASDIMRTGRLFGANPLLPVSPYYPGLENAALVLAQFVGLPLFWAAMLMLATARILMVLSLFALYDQVSHSHRVAGLATLIYLTNPSLLYFNAQFAYESLGLPLVLLLLWIEARRQSALPPARHALGALVGLILAALIVTHHLSSYVLSAFLILWTLTWLWVRSRSDGRRVTGPFWLTVGTLVGTLAWLLIVARVTIAYLGGNLLVTLREVVGLITRETTGRRLFHGFGADVAPLWEQLVTYGAVLGVMILLPLGLLAIWRRYRDQPLALALGIGTLAYPLTQALRITPFGLQVAGRTPEFLFLPLGFVLALAWFDQRASPETSDAGVVSVADVSDADVSVAGVGSRRYLRLLADRGRARVVSRVAFMLWVAVLLVGGVILGWPRWGRMPGPYLVVADARSIESQGLAVAQWARDEIEPQERVAADRMNALLLLAYGQLDPVTASYDAVNVPEMFFAQMLGPSERGIIHRGGIRLVVFDARLNTGTPSAGFYFEPGDRSPDEIVAPIGVALQSDLEVAPDAHRIMDSGDIVIFDVGAIRDAP